MTVKVNESIDFESAYKAVNLLDPTSAQDAATKAYVDAHIASYVPQTGAGSPYGTVTPSVAGSTYTNTATGDIWVASSTSNTSWRLDPGPAKRTWMRTAFR